MSEAYIVSAARTAGGRRNGAVAEWHPVDLGARILDEVVARAGMEPGAVEDVIMGCVTQTGEQSQHVGRNCVLASGLPESVPAVTIDRQCGSSQQAIHFAAQAVKSGAQDIVIAAGTESMSRVSMGSAGQWSRTAKPGTSTSAGILRRYPAGIFSQFVGAQMIADKWGLSRESMDAFALKSHLRSANAAQNGAFEREVLALPVLLNGETSQHTLDEGIRPDTSLDALAGLSTLSEGGSITAGNASQMCDGAAGIMIASEKAVNRNGLTPMARIHEMTVTAGDPIIMLEEPLYATEKALARAGLTLSDIDLFEVNEAFASVPMAWLKHLGADPAKLNVNGGAIALGHPLGASGAKLMTTLVHALQARGLKWGLQTMCEGGGIANVTIIEAL